MRRDAFLNAFVNKEEARVKARAIRMKLPKMKDPEFDDWEK